MGISSKYTFTPGYCFAAVASPDRLSM